MSLADEQSTFVVIIEDSGGNSAIYDAASPERTFEACLEIFLAAEKRGFLDHNQPEVREVLGLLDSDCREAGKMAYHYLQNNPNFTLTFKYRERPENDKFHF